MNARNKMKRKYHISASTWPQFKNKIKCKQEDGLKMRKGKGQGGKEGIDIQEFNPNRGKDTLQMK